MCAAAAPRRSAWYSWGIKYMLDALKSAWLSAHVNLSTLGSAHTGRHSLGGMPYIIHRMQMTWPSQDMLMAAGRIFFPVKYTSYTRCYAACAGGMMVCLLLSSSKRCTSKSYWARVKTVIDWVRSVGDSKWGHPWSTLGWCTWWRPTTRCQDA